MHSSSEASLSTGQVSSAALTPLLRLLCGSELPEITGAAEAVFRQRLEEAVGLEDSPAEVHLWLEMLPSRLGSPEQSRWTILSLILSSLAECMPYCTLGTYALTSTIK